MTLKDLLPLITCTSHFVIWEYVTSHRKNFLTNELEDEFVQIFNSHCNIYGELGYLDLDNYCVQKIYCIDSSMRIEVSYWEGEEIDNQN